MFSPRWIAHLHVKWVAECFSYTGLGGEIWTNWTKALTIWGYRFTGYEEIETRRRCNGEECKKQSIWCPLSIRLPSNASVVGLHTVLYTVMAVNLMVGVWYVPSPLLTCTHRHWLREPQRYGMYPYTAVYSITVIKNVEINSITR